MPALIGKKLGRGVVVLAAILLIDFAILHLPAAFIGDGEDLLSGRAEASQIAARQEVLRRRFGLDRPVFERFGRWIADVARFDFGDSMVEPRSVRAKIGEALPVTLLLQSCTIVVVFGIGVPLGLFLARRRDRAVDRGARTLLYAFHAVPDFWIATLLLVFLATGTGAALFPLERLASPDAERLGPIARLLDVAWHLVLPVVSLSIAGLAVVARHVRNAAIEALESDWVRAARAQGRRERAIVLGPVLRHVMVPVVTLLGGLLPALVGGSIVVERIFNLRGMGRLVWEATFARDYPVLQAVVLMVAILTLVGYALSDLLAALFDPRLGR